MLKRVALAAAIAFGGLAAGSASALSISQVDIIEDVAPITSAAGQLSSDGLGGFAFSPSVPFNGSQAGNAALFDIGAIENTVIPALSQVTILSGIPGVAPQLALFSSGPLDVRADLLPGDVFGISALYRADVNATGESAFDLFLVEITTGETNNPLTSEFVLAVDAAITVTPVAPIPLPATLPLLAAGIGGIVVLRRKRQAPEA